MSSQRCGLSGLVVWVVIGKGAREKAMTQGRGQGQQTAWNWKAEHLSDPVGGWRVVEHRHKPPRHRGNPPHRLVRTSSGRCELKCGGNSSLPQSLALRIPVTRVGCADRVDYRHLGRCRRLILLQTACSPLYPVHVTCHLHPSFFPLHSLRMGRSQFFPIRLYPGHHLGA